MTAPGVAAPGVAAFASLTLPAEAAVLDESPAAQYLLSRIDYERAIHVPYNQQRFRLERMAAFAAHLGNPQLQLPTVHVAGSKGKGSTAAMLAAMLTASGRRTGLYTSPHLLALEERIRVDGRPIGRDPLAETLARVRPTVQQMDEAALAEGKPWDRLTFFEIVTGLALVYFQQQRLDAVVLEVGLGGRLDSTNICQPACSVITSISLDHMQQLGGTLTKIAAEKAGIIKPGVPVVSGVLDPSAQDVIAARAHDLGCPLFRIGREFDYAYRPHVDTDDAHAARTELDYCELSSVNGSRWCMNDVTVSLLGRHQAANAAVALATMRRLNEAGWQAREEAQRRGLAQVRCPARVEVVGGHPLIILDAAHNGASMRALTETIEDYFAVPRAQRIVIFATTRGKDVPRMLSALLPWCGKLILTQYTHNPRACPPSQLAKTARRLQGALSASGDGTELILQADPPAALWAARQLADPQSLICVTGSFFLAAELRGLLHGAPSGACPSGAAQP